MVEGPSPWPQRGDGDSGGDDGHRSEEIRRNNTSARVPAGVASGVYASTVAVLFTQTEFVIDMLQVMSPPPRLVQRVVMPPSVMARLVAGMEQAMAQYEQRFGELPPPPRPAPDARPTPLEDVYHEMAYTDEALAGSYANTVRLNFNHSDFNLDFISSFLPHATVTSRVFLAAPQAKRALQSMQRSLQSYREKHGSGPSEY